MFQGDQVRILGNASNLALMPPHFGGEVWCCNQRSGYNKWLPRIIENSEWTRWFNLHSRKHIEETYPRDIVWYKKQTKPIFFQKHQKDIPASRSFPGPELQRFYGTATKPFRYFTCSGSWLLALALFEALEFGTPKRIELWGIEIKKQKPSWAWERPCIFYWINRCMDTGVDVWWPDDLDWDLSEAGNPSRYAGPLYGYETKPEL